MAYANPTLLDGDEWELKKDRRTMEFFLVLQRDGDSMKIPLDEEQGQEIINHAPYYDQEIQTVEKPSGKKDNDLWSEYDDK